MLGALACPSTTLGCSAPRAFSTLLRADFLLVGAISFATPVPPTHQFSIFPFVASLVVLCWASHQAPPWVGGTARSPVLPCLAWRCITPWPIPYGGAGTALT